MNEEEKQAIEKLNSIVKVHKDYMQGVNEETINEKEIKAIEIVLNYIDKLQKELQREKNRIMELAEMLDKKDEEIKRLETELELERNI